MATPVWTRRSRRVFAALLLAAAPGLVRAADPAPSGGAPPPPPAPPPDWVAHAGRSARFPDSRFATGYGVAEGEDALESARVRAAADLADRISVRIQHELRDVSEERDGRARYEVAAVTRSTSDVRLVGLDYETWQAHGTAWALAVLERAPAAARRRADRERALAELRACVADAGTKARAGRLADAARGYEGCTRPLAEALEHDAVARVLAPRPEADAAFHGEVLRLARAVDDGIPVSRRARAASLAEAADALALQLVRQGLDPQGAVTIAPFTLGATDLSSAFGREVALELERALARDAGGGGGARAAGANGSSPSEARSDAGWVLRGVYLEGEDGIRLLATVRDLRSGRLAAGAETMLARDAAPSPAALRPANLEAALRDQRVLAEGERTSGDLRIELWTQRGARGVVLSEGERLRLYARVSRPAWVRLVYVLESGAPVLVDPGWYLDASQVDRVVEYPESFEVVAPFGVEHVLAVASRERPGPLATTQRSIAGVEYPVIRDGMDALVRQRARGRAGDGIAEAFVSVTTVPRRAGGG